MSDTPPPVPPADQPAPRRRSAAPFIVIGVVVAVVVVGGLLLCLLSAILLPALGQARQTARGVVEQQNLIAIAQALGQYASANDGVYPPPDDAWFDTLVDAGYLTPDIGESLFDNQPGLDYAYAGPPAAAMPAADAALVYTAPHLADATGSVAYADQSVGELTREEWQAFLDSRPETDIVPEAPIAEPGG